MRAAIIDTVEERPGIHFRELQREISCSASTLEYHLDAAVLRDREIRGYRRIYPRDTPRRFDSPLAALNHIVRGKIICLVSEQACTAADITDGVEKAASTVSHHLSVLADAKVLQQQQDGRKRIYSVTPVTDEAITVYPSLLNHWTTSFAQMWE